MMLGCAPFRDAELARLSVSQYVVEQFMAAVWGTLQRQHVPDGGFYSIEHEHLHPCACCEVQQR